MQLTCQVAAQCCMTLYFLVHPERVIHRQLQNISGAMLMDGRWVVLRSSTALFNGVAPPSRLPNLDLLREPGGGVVRTGLREELRLPSSGDLRGTSSAGWAEAECAVCDGSGRIDRAGATTLRSR